MVSVPQRLWGTAASKAVAIYVAVTIVNETVGRGFGNQAIVAFKSEPITVSDVLSVIERLSGGPFPVPTEISYPPGNWTFTKWTIGGDSFTGYSLDAILAGVRGKGWELYQSRVTGKTRARRRIARR